MIYPQTAGESAGLGVVAFPQLLAHLNIVTTTMEDSPSVTSLLTALNCRGHVHLIIGTNPLAATRCSQSLSAGAIPVLIAPETSELHYGLSKRIDAGEVTWHKESFQDNNLFTLGRADVEHVVDAVFVTSGSREATCEFSNHLFSC